ncbi:MAG: DUF4397 domain-containing protein [Bacteroidota bacterium]
MKISINIKTIIAVLALAVGFTSCSKKYDQSPVYISGLSIIHASPTDEKLDVFVDNTKANLSDFAFGDKIDYLNAYSGSRQLTVTKKGNTSPLTTEQFTLKPQIGYSLFVVDKLESVKFLFLEDDLTIAPTGKARVRFVNLSPDADALSLAIDGQTTDLVTNKSFKEYSTFETIDAADKVTFNVKNDATGAVETSIADVKIESGKIYTVWVKGLKSATDETKLGVAVFTHK